MKPRTSKQKAINKQRSALRFIRDNSSCICGSLDPEDVRYKDANGQEHVLSCHIILANDILNRTDRRKK